MYSIIMIHGSNYYVVIHEENVSSNIYVFPVPVSFKVCGLTKLAVLLDFNFGILL